MILKLCRPNVKSASHLRRDKLLGLTVHPKLVEGWTVKLFMVRQAHHERLNPRLSRLKLVAKISGINNIPEPG